MKVYGIANCNTVKKTLDWLKLNHVDYEFHDFKKLGISESKLREWADELGWEALINKRGTTWKQLDPNMKDSIVSPEAAFILMQEKPSMIKRPVVESPDGLLAGFDEIKYKQVFKK